MCCQVETGLALRAPIVIWGHGLRHIVSLSPRANVVIVSPSFEKDVLGQVGPQSVSSLMPMWLTSLRERAKLNDSVKLEAKTLWFYNAFGGRPVVP